MVSIVVVECYNAFFCAVLAYSINDTLRTPLLTQGKAHLLCLFGCLCACTILLFAHDATDLTRGMCIYRVGSSSSLSQCAFHICLLLIALFSMRLFRSKIPKNSYFESKSHFRYSSTHTATTTPTCSSSQS